LLKKYRGHLKKIWRLDMGMILIDIDKLLETTSDLTSEKNYPKIKTIEIDQLLEKTRDW
jgi:hypothetical protein